MRTFPLLCMSTSKLTIRPDRTSISKRIDDEARLRALRQYQILDTEPEPAFDRVSRLAAHLFDASTAIVNLVEDDRQWFKSTVGFNETETGLDVSFCVYTVERGEVFVVEDLSEDERFEDNPYVTEHGVRFYAGAPLITPNDHCIGTLCVLDTEPRSPDEDLLHRLSDLADMVVDELELRKEKAEHEQARADLEESQELLRQAQEVAQVGGWTYDPQTEDLTWTDETYRIHDLPTDHEIDVEGALDFYAPASRPVIRSHVEALQEEGGRYDLELDIETAEGRYCRVRTIGEAQQSDGEATQLTGAIQDITERHQAERLQETQSAFFEWIAGGAPIQSVLGEICQFADDQLDGAAVSILRRDGEVLRHAAGGALPSDYVEAIEGGEMDEAVGPCARAVTRGDEVIAEDVRSDPQWKDYCPSGFRSCWALPIRGKEDECLGAVGVYGPEPRTPDAREKELVHQLAHVASVALARERHEQALRRSEERYRTLVEHFPGAVFLYDDNLRCTLAAGNALEQVGLTREEIEGATPEDRYSPQIAGPLMDALQSALDGEHRELEQSLGGRHYHLQAIPIREGEACMAVSLDVTERRQAQRELREQTEMLQAIFDKAPVMMGLVEDGKLTFVNKHFERTLGWTRKNDESESGLLRRCYPDPEDRVEALSFIKENAGEWRDFRPLSKDGDPVDTTWKHVVLSDGRSLGIGVDISERKARERELHESNERLRLALEAADAGTFDYDISEEQVRWDQRTRDLFGVDLDSPVHEADLLDEIVVGDDLPHLQDVFERATEEGGRFDISFRIRRGNDGELRHIRSRGLVLRDEEGTADRIVGVNQDVTDRRERKEQLRLLEAAVEHSRLTVLITEANTLDEPGPEIVYANPVFTEVTGYEADEVIGRSPRFLQGPDTDQAALDRIRTALEEEEPVREILLNYTKDGTPYWNDLFIAPVRDDDGTVTHYVSVQDDVTERRRQEEVLERQNDLFTKAQDIADIGAWEYDVRSGETIFTEQAYHIQGLEPGEEISPERTISLFHPEDQQAAREAFTRAVEEGESYDLELRIITDDGEHRWVRTRGEPQTENEEVVRLRGTIQDITERIQRQKELKEAKEAAEEADRIKTALLSNMNHEIRTPLTSIITFSELIRENPEIARRFVDRIYGGGKRLLYTLNTVMDFAALETEDRSVTVKSVQLREVVESVVNELRERARKKGIDLSVEMPEHLSSMVLDQYRVERILTHLLHNAIKFTDEGSVTVSIRVDDEAVTLQVTDTGVGIDPAFQPRVFDEFAQQSSGYDRTYEGNGLGLTVVRRFVDEIGGEIDLKSEPGEGTQVTVRLL